MAKFTEQQKLYKKIQKQFNRATKDYSMFADGDKILVALSGGKDSLTLLQLMSERSRIFKPSISIVAAHVTMVNIPYKTNTAFLQEFCDSLGVGLHIIESSFDASTDKRKSPCFLCSWNRRKALFTLAQELECNKIANAEKYTREEMVELLEKSDHKRENYYNYFTYKQWGAAASYDLCLNSSLLGIDGCVKVISDIIRSKGWSK